MPLQPLNTGTSWAVRVIYHSAQLFRATLWESGNLVVEALDVKTEAQVLQKVFETTELWQLDDKLNWWLSEVATYEP